MAAAPSSSERSRLFTNLLERFNRDPEEETTVAAAPSTEDFSGVARDPARPKKKMSGKPSKQSSFRGSSRGTPRISSRASSAVSTKDKYEDISQSDKSISSSQNFSQPRSPLQPVSPTPPLPQEAGGHVPFSEALKRQKQNLSKPDALTSKTSAPAEDHGNGEGGEYDDSQAQEGVAEGTAASSSGLQSDSSDSFFDAVDNPKVLQETDVKSPRRHAGADQTCEPSETQETDPVLHPPQEISRQPAKEAEGAESDAGGAAATLAPHPRGMTAAMLKGANAKAAVAPPATMMQGSEETTKSTLSSMVLNVKQSPGSSNGNRFSDGDNVVETDRPGSRKIEVAQAGEIDDVRMADRDDPRGGKDSNTDLPQLENSLLLGSEDDLSLRFGKGDDDGDEIDRLDVGVTRNGENGGRIHARRTTTSIPGLNSNGSLEVVRPSKTSSNVSRSSSVLVPKLDRWGSFTQEDLQRSFERGPLTRNCRGSSASDSEAEDITIGVTATNDIHERSVEDDDIPHRPFLSILPPHAPWWDDSEYVGVIDEAEFGTPRTKHPQLDTRGRLIHLGNTQILSIHRTKSKNVVPCTTGHGTTIHPRWPKLL